MNYVNTIFNQLLNFLPKNEFNKFVGQHNGDRYVKSLTTWNQLVALLYAQATGKDSLRDIETGLKTHANNWYHLGIKSVARSSLSYANNNRSYEIYEKLFYALLNRCKDVLPERKFTFTNPLYSFDATSIDLCLNIFDWAKSTKTKGAIKIHTLLNNKSSIPEFLTITDGKVADITALKGANSMNLPKGSILVFDRAYVDYCYWQKLNKKEVFFVSRTKSSQNIFVFGQHTKPLDKGVISDQKVILASYKAHEQYPDSLRLVRYYDSDKDKEYEYLTNNFDLKAIQIATIYKDRWQIELFFKWIKQNLKIKSFLGTTQNAVMTQVWIAMIYFLLLSYIKFQTKFKKSLLEFTRMIRETLMMRRHLIDLLSLNTTNLNRLKQVTNPQTSFW